MNSCSIIDIGPQMTYDHSQLIGKSFDGMRVFTGTFKNIKVAVKRSNFDRIDIDARNLLWKTVGPSHKNLIKYYQFIKHTEFLFLVMELCDFDLTHCYTESFDVINDIDFIKNVFTQTVNGLSFLHGLHIVHSSLKPSNILLNVLCVGKKEFAVKLTDFGITHRGYSDSTALAIDDCDSPLYTAPEVLANDTMVPTKAGDIFSLGCILFFLLNKGLHPFELEEIPYYEYSDEHWRVKKNNVTLVQQNQGVSKLSPLNNDLVLRMIDSVPEQRLTIELVADIIK